LKSCPVCDADYPDQHTTCPTDGAVLIVSQELAPGSLVRGKYRIVRKLGQGGMGIVYLADDTLLGVRVALKFLAGDLGKDPKFIKRFRMEARAAYQLRHPNIVEVTSLDQGEDGSLFIAMEFVEGPSLRTVIEQAAGGLDISRALEISRDIASGLGAAHAQGTVHRDIKPENILLTRAADGREKPKILDFGIAAVAESVTRLSMTRGFLLTPDYAAPEQWLEMPADEMDGRTDLYALGCVLYEMLTGGKPFHAHNTSGLMKQHLEETPRSPSVLRSELANWEGLDALLLRLLAKGRDQRPKDALELLSLLDAVRYVPAEQRRETLLEDTWKKRTETVVEEAAVRPNAVTEQTQAAPAPTVAISEHSLAQPSYQLFSELDSGSEGFPRWAWAALAILVLAASFAAWRFFAPHSQPREAQGPVTQPILQPESTTQPARQVTNSAPTSQLPGTAEQPKSPQMEDTKPKAQAPLLPQVKPVPEEKSKPSVSRPEVAQQSKPASSDIIRPPLPAPQVAEQPKPTSEPPVQEQSIAELEQHAAPLDGQRRYAEAMPLLDQACAKGGRNACGTLGGYYRDGLGVTPDYSRAAALFTKACDLGNSKACNNLGAMYSNGRGFATDFPRAVTFFTKACNAGFVPGCSNLGTMYGDGLGVAADYSRAATLFSNACNAGDAQGCSDLGNLYWLGHGVEKNSDKAKLFLSKGCDMGNQWGCDLLKKFR
jgi:serine/threonine protein kinase